MLNELHDTYQSLHAAVTSLIQKQLTKFVHKEGMYVYALYVWNNQWLSYAERLEEMLFSFALLPFILITEPMRYLEERGSFVEVRDHRSMGAIGSRTMAMTVTKQRFLFLLSVVKTWILKLLHVGYHSIQRVYQDMTQMMQRMTYHMHRLRDCINSSASQQQTLQWTRHLLQNPFDNTYKTVMEELWRLKQCMIDRERSQCKKSVYHISQVTFDDEEQEEKEEDKDAIDTNYNIEKHCALKWLMGGQNFLEQLLGLKRPSSPIHHAPKPVDKEKEKEIQLLRWKGGKYMDLYYILAVFGSRVGGVVICAQHLAMLYQRKLRVVSGTSQLEEVKHVVQSGDVDQLITLVYEELLIQSHMPKPKLKADEEQTKGKAFIMTRSSRKRLHLYSDYKTMIKGCIAAFDIHCNKIKPWPKVQTTLGNQPEEDTDVEKDDEDADGPTAIMTLINRFDAGKMYFALPGYDENARKEEEKKAQKESKDISYKIYSIQKEGCFFLKNYMAYIFGCEDSCSFKALLYKQAGIGLYVLKGYVYRDSNTASTKLECNLHGQCGMARMYNAIARCFGETKLDLQHILLKGYYTMSIRGINALTRVNECLSKSIITMGDLEESFVHSLMSCHSIVALFCVPLMFNLEEEDIEEFGMDVYAHLYKESNKAEKLYLQWMELNKTEVDSNVNAGNTVPTWVPQEERGQYQARYVKLQKAMARLQLLHATYAIYQRASITCNPNSSARDRNALVVDESGWDNYGTVVDSLRALVKILPSISPSTNNQLASSHLEKWYWDMQLLELYVLITEKVITVLLMKEEAVFMILNLCDDYFPVEDTMNSLMNERTRVLLPSLRLCHGSFYLLDQVRAMPPSTTTDTNQLRACFDNNIQAIGGVEAMIQCFETSQYQLEQALLTSAEMWDQAIENAIRGVSRPESASLEEVKEKHSSFWEICSLFKLITGIDV